MKEYQPIKNNPYRLPHNLYMRALYHIRDYDRMISERQEVLYSSKVNDGAPRGSRVGMPTEGKAVRLVKIDEDCEAVERALNRVPPEYRKGVLNNICYGSPYPIDAGYSTYSRWRQRFIYWTAKNLHWI